VPTCLGGLSGQHELLQIGLKRRYDQGREAHQQQQVADGAELPGALPGQVPADGEAGARQHLPEGKGQALVHVPDGVGQVV